MPKVVLIGDFLLGDRPIEIDGRIIELCADADHVLVNLEAPITGAPAAPKPAGPTLTSSRRVVDELRRLDVSVGLLANNHIMDHGVAGLADTIEELEAVGIATAGAAVAEDGREVLEVSAGERTLAVLAYAHSQGPMLGRGQAGPRPLPPLTDLERQVGRLKAEGAIVVVSYHGGEELLQIPWPRRRAFLRAVSRAGADVMFAHHAHAPQPFEITGGRLVVYSPGDFFIDTDVLAGFDYSRTGSVVGVDLAARTVTVLRTHAIYEPARVRVQDIEVVSLSEDRELDTCAYARTWSALCRARLAVTPPRLHGTRLAFLSPVWNVASLLRRLRHQPTTQRDVDIVASSLPAVGRRYSAWLQSRDPYRFRF